MNAPDQILLEGLRFYGYHGVLPAEAQLGQTFVIDLAIETDLHMAGQSDDVADTISYAEIFTYVRSIVEGERYNLLEALAERIATAIITQYAQAQAVRVKVTKPNAPIPSLGTGSVAVAIRRER